MGKIPEYGQHMTLAEFVGYVEARYLIDDDGFGHYATENQMSQHVLTPSDVEHGNVDHSFSHVVWFNK